MRLPLRSVAHAIDLLVEYNGGKRTRDEEAQLLEEGTAYAAREFRRLGEARYYRESESIKYDLLRWHLKTQRWMWDFRILEHLVRPGTLVDFGAGIGLSACALASAGLEVTAVEVSLDSDTVRFGRFLIERLGVRGVTYADRIPAGPVDNVLCMDVLEHFPDWRVPARALVGALRPGGAFCMHAPFEDGHDEDSDHPQHYPSPEPVEPFLRSLGLAPHNPFIWRKAAGPASAPAPAPAPSEASS